MKLNKYDLEMKREGEINASEGLSSYVRALNFYTSTFFGPWFYTGDCSIIIF